MRWFSLESIGGGGTRQIHKITSEWDSRKGTTCGASHFVTSNSRGSDFNMDHVLKTTVAGVEDLTPNDLMIKFTERSIEATGALEFSKESFNLNTSNYCTSLLYCTS